ncbi:MAG: hypothetical protein V3U67_06775 [Gemmatimonadota bacterium]
MRAAAGLLGLIAGIVGIWFAMSGRGQVAEAALPAAQSPQEAAMPVFTFAEAW